MKLDRVLKELLIFSTSLIINNIISKTGSLLITKSGPISTQVNFVHLVRFLHQLGPGVDKSLKPHK